MNNIEACKHVMEHGVSLVRPRKDAPEQYDVKGFFTGSKRGWFALDATTAGAIVAVFEALEKTQSAENLAKIYRISFPRLVAFAFKHVKLG